MASLSYACPGTWYFSDSAGLGVMDIAALGKGEGHPVGALVLESLI